MSDVVNKLFEPQGQIIKLPSRGLFNGPKEVEVRGFITKDEKDWLRIDFDNPTPGLRSLAQNVVVKPAKFNFDNCIDADVMAILLTSKSLTYGDEIIGNAKCPHCETIQKTTIYFADLPMRMHPKFKLPLKCKLPNSKVVIYYNILTIGDIKKIESSSKQFEKILGPAFEDSQYYVIAHMIEKIEDKEGNVIDLDIFEKIEFVEKMPKADTDAWLIHRDKYDANPELKYSLDCINCQSKSEQQLVIGYDFFYLKTVEPALSITTT